jgi:adenine-specific DNA-methyltransferase
MTDKLEKLTPEDGQSLNIEAQHIEQLKQLFPDVFREGKVDFEALKAVLGEHVEDKEERYNFTWHGKNKARQIAQTPSTGTLRPCKEESINWDTTQNLYIEGDNLEVLKLLQKSYHQKVKMIYIDPPYNTGKDFVYKDSFKDNIGNYLRLTNQVDQHGKEFSSNTESSGRYHTDWLNMMYARLKLAKNLLKDDGVIFISIDDNEKVNLQKICDEIFGEDNFYANIVWQRKDTPANDAKGFSVTHEYCLIYTKTELFKRKLLPRGEEQLKNYKNPDDDPRGVWTRGALTRPEANEKDYYAIKNPIGMECYPPKGSSWRVSKETFERFKSENRLWWGNKGDGNMPFQKKFLTEVQDGVVPITWWDYKSSGSMRNSKMELRVLFGNNPPFDFPKPTQYLTRLMRTVLDFNSEEIVLDFFSGSASTADAIINLNRVENGKTKFIMVQIPELTSLKSEAYKMGYKNIADIGKDRIRRVGEKLLDEFPDYIGDLGFKVFKLDRSNIKQWEPDFDNLSDILDNNVDSIKTERTSEDVLYEILLKYGLDLTYPITEHTLAGKNVYDVAFGSLIVCLEDGITREVVEGIGKLKQELDSETTRVVFKDAGFADDAVKVNAIQLLKQYGVDDVKSI